VFISFPTLLSCLLANKNLYLLLQAVLHKEDMAFLQSFCVFLVLVSFSKAKDLTTDTTVFRFSPLKIKDNYIVIQPNASVTNSTGIQYY
jgi:hypothetical protein